MLKDNLRNRQDDVELYQLWEVLTVDCHTHISLWL